MSTRPLRMWVIYNSPRDHPGKFVVRLFNVYPSGPEPQQWHVVCDGLDDARDHVPAGLVRINRDARDEPQIVESWL